MREIKFRGFHKCKDGKTVITVKGKKKRGTWFYGSYCPYTWSFASRRINEPQIIIHDENNENDGLWVEVVPETVGQYTGLKDKNGKEIYEGDILKIINGTAVVDFHYSTLYHIEHHPVEIIGNIHGNELMEKNNENNYTQL